MTQHDGPLAVLPQVRVFVQPDGRFLLTKKFLSGMQAYAAGWNGPITAVIHPAETAFRALDGIALGAEELPFTMVVARQDRPEVVDHLKDQALVLASVSHLQNHISRLAGEQGVPSIYVSEYTLRTRLQIAQAEETKQLRLVKRSIWERLQERRYRSAMGQAMGLQANGIPAYEAYGELTPNSLLYFDTRTHEDAVVDADQLEQRLAYLDQNKPLRLAFSGRLTPMKGPEHLIEVAVVLAERNLPFQLTVYGDGESVPWMRKRIAEAGLEDRVTLAGVLDFQRELVPRMKEEVDLFVCCHRQGDPSCTYLETMACGVPIVGYRNEAWAGLEKIAQAGWGVPLNDVRQMADQIAAIDKDRQQLAAMSRSALAFARQHTFEKTFANRIEHMRQVATSGLSPS